MRSLAVMQGRLLPPIDGRIQGFPAGRWAAEFACAERVGFSAIEWIYEQHGLDDNPLATIAGCRVVNHLQRDHGVAVRSVCLDFLMDEPVTSADDARRHALGSQVVELSARVAGLGVQRFVVPFVDASSVQDSSVWDKVIPWITEVAAGAAEHGVEIHVEADLSPIEFVEFLSQIGSGNVFVNYDSGNSAALGFDAAEELAAYGDRIGSVHIKDREKGGGSVPLGTGAADFAPLRDFLRGASYAGDVVLQVARGAAGEEEQWLREQAAIARRLLGMDEAE